MINTLSLDRWLQMNQHAGQDYDAEVLEICPENLRAEYEVRLEQQIVARTAETR